MKYKADKNMKFYKVNKDNVDIAIISLEEFCKRKSDEYYYKDIKSI